MRLIQFITLVLLSPPLFAQWHGDTSNYDIFPDSLQLNGDNVNGGKAYLSKSSDIIEDAIWEFHVAMDFSPSSSNYAQVYLVSDNEDLSGNGYYVKIGGSYDEVSLYRQDGMAHTEIIDGLDKRVDSKKVAIDVKVMRTNGLWSLFSNVNQTVYKKEGEVYDLSYMNSSYFGVQATYTKTRASHFYFSQFLLTGNAFVDNTAPRLDSLVAATRHQCFLYFNETVQVNTISYNGEPAKSVTVDGKMVKASFESSFLENDSSQLQIHVSDTSSNVFKSPKKLYYTAYEVLFASMQTPSVLAFQLSKPTDSITIENVSLDGQHPMSIVCQDDVWLATFFAPIPPRILVTLTLEHIVDINGDPLRVYNKAINYFELEQNDIVFNEIMADPSPKVTTLPEVEYIELYNASDFEVNVTNWVLQKKNSSSFILPTANIASQGYLLLGNAAAMDSFPEIVNKVAMSDFPTLANAGMSLLLKTDKRILIDSLTYSLDWHSSEAKNGGYALSRNVANEASEEFNFHSSCAVNGGTPGAPNCDESPVLESFAILSKNKMQLVFNERVIVNSITYSGIEANVTDALANVIEATFASDFLERDSFIVNIKVQDANANVFHTKIKLFYIPFEVTSVVMKTGNEMHLTFSKTVTDIKPEQIHLNGKIPIKITFDSQSCIVKFKTPLENRATATLQIKGILDVYGDTLNAYNNELSYFIAEFGDVIFNELMPNPSPVVTDLPEVEYIELFNRTDFSISIQNWHWVIGKRAYVLPNYQLRAHETIIISAPMKSTLFSNNVKCISMPQFPSLSNNSMSLQMLSANGSLIDAISYNSEWHRDDFRRNGGFSLERIDTDNLSQENNWMSSCSESGGTPGVENCAIYENPDDDAPYVKHAYALDSSHIFVMCSELVLTTSVLQVNHYSILNGLKIDSILPSSDFLHVNSFLLKLSETMSNNVIYELSISGVRDVTGNEMEMKTYTLAVCDLPKANDILINEIMYAPLSGEAEYVELYNNTDAPFDLSQLKITKLDNNGVWESGKFVSEIPRLLLPRNYMALSHDISTLVKQYSLTSATVSEIVSMPSLGNESGNIAILLPNATVIDALCYSDSWQSTLLNDTHGVALERLSTELATNESTNWFSASSLVNYGTPGGENSQKNVITNTYKTMEVSPVVFTPDGDGIDDFITINIGKEYEGTTIRMQIFNQRGIVVKELVNNLLIGAYSNVVWDGAGTNGRRCPMGQYLIWTEIVTAQGEVIIEKLECVISIKMR